MQQDASSDSLVRDALKQINSAGAWNPGSLELEILGYCESLPQESKAAIECWEAYDYFADEAMGAELQCDIDSPSGEFKGQACNNFLQWESFVRQVGVCVGR